MKKLLIILLLIPIICNSQIKQDKINHLAIGYLIGFAGNGLTYNLLANKTNIKPLNCKIMSFAISNGLGLLAGHIKEKYDSNNEGFYNKKDFNFTGVGTLAGSLSITLIIGKSMPENRIPIKDIYDLENETLILSKYNHGKN
jgi:hypothetical protein